MFNKHYHVQDRDILFTSNVFTIISTQGRKHNGRVEFDDDLPSPVVAAQNKIFFPADLISLLTQRVCSQDATLSQNDAKIMDSL